MRSSAQVVHWQSTAEPSICGLEIADPRLGKGRLTAELDRMFGSANTMLPRFVVVSGLVCARDVESVLSQLLEFVTATKVCLALDHQTLRSLNATSLRHQNLAVLLDGVNADTPLGAIAADCIEAIRFEEAFSRRAGTDVRLSCVLDSFVRLAHDLGLATFGFASASNCAFDYVGRESVSEALPA